MHWRNTGNHAMFLGADARASYPFMLFIVHWAYWTFSLWIGSIIVFGILQYYGYTVPNAFRFVRSFLAGKVVEKKPFWRHPSMERYPKP